jgi:hypothetical protein
MRRQTSKLQAPKKTRGKTIRRERSEKKLDLEGLGFPDNFMAIMEWQRVTKA